MKVNLGSGKNYRIGYTNIDINPLWKPDIVADISRTLPLGYINACDEIIAHDVLEHIPDLVAAMTNCLLMLKIDGIMDIIVPYDLSLGAWQDPTHVRAFNQNSWLYYTDWFWYLGWMKYRFKLEQINFVLNPKYSDAIIDDNLLSMPRVIDSMHVILKKIPLSEEDRKIVEAYHGIHQ